MSRDDIIRMAREANLHERTKVVGGYIVNIPNLENLERFAAMVAAAEREKCIEVLLGNFDIDDKNAFEIAAAIRARGEV
jgi:hypothetical protein